MNIEYSNGTETCSEHELRQRYRYELDDSIGVIRIGDLMCLPSQIIEKLYPIAFRCGFYDWRGENQGGWVPCTGSITKSGTGTQAADGVHS